MKPQPIATAYDLTTGRGRLRYLADEVLARVTREERKFVMEVFWRDPNDCGTAACAVGWAVRDPLLNAQGISVGNYGLPSYQGLDCWSGIRKFFGISELVSAELFTPGHYISTPAAADVADRIRAYLAETEGV